VEMRGLPGHSISISAGCSRIGVLGRRFDKGILAGVNPASYGTQFVLTGLKEFMVG
jgi:hypothetical protein